MLEIDMKNKIINKVVEKINPSFIILFGSFAKWTVHESSDLALAYFRYKKLSSYDRFILAGELACFVNRVVDLVDIQQIDAVISMQFFKYVISISINDI